MRYIALLRGINVGGNTMIRMSELRASFELLGLQNVVSYINSGNLAFDLKNLSGGDRAVAEKIEKAIKKDFDLNIQVMVREQASIADVLVNNPFNGKFESHKDMHVLFMKEEMPKDKQKELLEKNNENEKFAIRGREIYAHLSRGVADSLLGKGFIEKRLKVPITARNWRTVEKLVDL